MLLRSSKEKYRRYEALHTWNIVGLQQNIKEYVLIFDWYRGSLRNLISRKKIYVFASHSHYDHFNKKNLRVE